MSHHSAMAGIIGVEAKHHEFGADLKFIGENGGITIMNLPPAVARAMADAYNQAINIPHDTSAE